MGLKTPFLGPAYTSRSKNLADCRLINLYPEIVESKQGKAVGGFYMTPGLDLLNTVGVGPHRGADVMGGLLYCVSGNGVYSVDTNWQPTLLGTIGTNNGEPVSIINNGIQLAIFDGIAGYLVQSGAVSGIALPFSGPVSGSYQDSFGLVNEKDTDVWWQSDSFDLSTWNPLNFTSADAQPTDIVTTAEIHREQWLFKSDGIEIWINAGLPGFAFQRLEGVYIEEGCGAEASVAKLGIALAWITQDERGQGQAMIANGYSPQRISTHAVEREWASYPTISDAIAYACQIEGHLCYVVTFPSGNATWVYDLTTSQMAGIPIWYQLASFSNGQFSRHRGNTYAFFNGKHLVGDWQSGKLFGLSLDAQTDAGLPRKWLRSWRALKDSTLDPVRFSSLTIDMQTGIGVPDGTSPLVVLRWSDDGGHTWSNERTAQAGPPGKTAQRVKFNRLGATRRSSGLDRIFELSSTDRFSVALIGAELE